MKLVILGAPGAGKGTQARNIAAHYRIAHIASSDLLREHLNENPDPEMQGAIAKGSLAPDTLMIRLIKERIAKADCAGGYIFDGFPRTLVQAQELGGFVPDLDCAVSVEVADEQIVERISGRVICPKCGMQFHTYYYPPKTAGVCDACGAALIQREDDKTLTVLHRLKVYHEMTEPIKRFYGERGILRVVDGVGEIPEITEKIIAAVG